MKILKAILALAAALYCLSPTAAQAQCTGQFAAGFICGNPTGAQGLPRGASPGAFGLPTGPGTTGIGQIAIWNNTTGTLLERTLGTLYSAAACDGTANDVATINAEVITLQGIGGGTLILPSGTCIIGGGTPISLLSGVTLAGFGQGATVLRVSPSGDQNIAFIQAVLQSNVAVRDLTLDMIVTTTDNNGALNAGISCLVCTGFSVYNVTINNQGSFGLVANGGSAIRFTNNTLNKPARQTNRWTTLNGGINSSVTTLTLANATGYLSGGGTILIDSEFITYAALNTGTGVATGLTRGAFGSVAASHLNGALVQGAARQNQAVLISDSAGAVTNVLIQDNYFNGSAIDVGFSYGSIDNNLIADFTFGAGITTEQSITSHHILITNNTIVRGRGNDVNLTVAEGIESWSAFSTIANNVIAYNDGTGISQGGQNSTVTGNVVTDNAQYYTAGTLNGIVSRAGASAVYNANNTTYSSNRSSNTATTLNGGINSSVTSLTVTSASLWPPSGYLFIKTAGAVEKMAYSAVNTATGVVTISERGAGGSTAASHSNGDPVSIGYQVYGYSEENVALTGVSLTGNTFSGNITASTNILSATTLFGTSGAVKVIGGETALDGANPTPVTTGLTTITSCTLTIKLATAPGLGTSTVTYGTSGGTLNMYGWKPTGAGDTTLIASAGTETIGWICTGN